MQPEFLLFGTQGCHLCEQAKAIVEFVQSNLQQQWIFEGIDICDNAQCYEKYALTIPVFFHVQSQKQLGWPFDEQALAQFIAELKIGLLE